MKPITPTTSASSPTSELITGTQRLHEICVSAAEIARRMHVDQATVLHIIKHGTVPYRQLPLLWRDEPATSYEHPTP
jgi:hypothetical protein